VSNVRCFVQFVPGTGLTCDLTGLTRSPCLTCSTRRSGRQTSSMTGGRKKTGPHSSGPRGMFICPITPHLCGSSLTLPLRDTTGYGFHGDFGSGWDPELLQHVIDECDSTPDQLNGIIDACPLLTIQEIPEAQKCKTPILSSEDITGPMDSLPGENPILLLMS